MSDTFRPEAVAAAHVVTVAGDVLSPGWVGIEDGRIREVRAGPPPRELAVQGGGEGSILLPGLVSAHTHLALGGLRHVADDRPFLEWLLRGIVPAIEALSRVEGAFLAGARRSAGELLRGGVTCVADNFLRAEGVAALRETGQRGIFFQEVFGSLAPDEAAYIGTTDKELDLLPGLLQEFPFGYSPHTPWTCPERTFEAFAARARHEGRRLSFHLAESAEEAAFFRDGAGPLHEMIARRGTLDRYRFGRSVTAHVRALGGLGPDVVAAHAIQVDDEDIAALAATGTSVAHCPISNQKLAEGIAPVARFLEAGVNVALGVDSAASTGRLDVFAEMRACLLAQRGQERRTSGLTAATALRMATLSGARALGMDADLGSIETGKAADLVLIRCEEAARPGVDPVAVAVWDGGPEAVLLVLVDGRVRWRRPA